MLPFYSTFSGPHRTRQVALGRPFLDGDGHPPPARAAKRATACRQAHLGPILRRPRPPSAEMAGSASRTIDRQSTDAVVLLWSLAADGTRPAGPVTPPGCRAR